MIDPEHLKTIQRIARVLAPKYTFGYYDVDDITQEGIIEGIAGLDRWDGKRSLSAFMWTLINNRLKNFKRNNFVRPCPKGITEEDWNLKQAPKKNIMEPASLGYIRDEHEKNTWTKVDFINDIEIEEIFNLIDKELPMQFRHDYLRIKQGATISKAKRVKVEEILIEILREFGYEAG